MTLPAQTLSAKTTRRMQGCATTSSDNSGRKIGRDYRTAKKKGPLQTTSKVYSPYWWEGARTGLLASSFSMPRKLIIRDKLRMGMRSLRLVKTPLTVSRIWEKFNGRTRMMKGLFNYETAFREYTRDCLVEFVKENVQYAEIRPNFMKSNQIWTDDGKTKIDNEGTLRIIIHEYEQFMKENGVMRSNGQIVENRPQYQLGKGGYAASNTPDRSTLQKKMPIPNDHGQEKPPQRPIFSGLKVIYCTPRIFPREEVREMLAECLEFKKKWPEYIAGFDLVGEESKGHPLSFFKPEFEEFVRNCRDEKVDIPFLFHCGETHYDPDENLKTALAFENTKRIGHGYALLSETDYDDTMKKRRICVESCPISNEILGLNSRIAEHAVYGLIKRGLACTLNSDNGTLFR